MELKLAVDTVCSCFPSKRPGRAWRRMMSVLCLRAAFEGGARWRARKWLHNSRRESHDASPPHTEASQSRQERPHSQYPGSADRLPPHVSSAFSTSTSTGQVAERTKHDGRRSHNARRPTGSGGPDGQASNTPTRGQDSPRRGQGRGDAQHRRHDDTIAGTNVANGTKQAGDGTTDDGRSRKGSGRRDLPEHSWQPTLRPRSQSPNEHRRHQTPSTTLLAAKRTPWC